MPMVLRCYVRTVYGSTDDVKYYVQYENTWVVYEAKCTRRLSKWCESQLKMWVGLVKKDLGCEWGRGCR
jgi:hypothetical protein